MADKDREIRMGESRMYLGEDNIVFRIVVGVVDEKMATAFNKASIKLRSKAGGRVVNTFIDLTRAGKPTPEGRRIGQQRLDAEGIGKIAIFGMHPVAKVIASFVMGVTRKKDMRFFESREKALSWLKEE